MTPEAFVYMWFDLGRDMRYIGAHKGSPDDGYVCSSDIMLPEHAMRPQEFRRQVVHHGAWPDMLLKEQELIVEHNAVKDPKYYNQACGFGPYHHQGPHSEETKKKLSDLARMQWEDPVKRELLISIGKKRCENPSERKRLSEQMKKFWKDDSYAADRAARNKTAGLSISKTKLGIPLSDKHKRALCVPKSIPVWNKGLRTGPLSIEHKEKQRISMTGHKFTIIQCPHCGTIGGETAMRRWHFDKCKRGK